MSPTARLLPYIFLLPLAATGQDVGPVIDPLTAEPIPAALAPPPADVVGDSHGPVELLSHWPRGMAGPVRWIHPGIPELIFRDGTAVVLAEIQMELSSDRGIFIYEISSLVLDAPPQDIFVGDGRFFVAARGRGGLKVVEATLPPGGGTFSLELLGEAPGFDALAVAAAGDFAYVGAGLEGVRVYDVSDGSAPQIVETVSTGGSANGLHLAGDRLYVANGEPDDAAGLLIFDVAEPAAPQLLGGFDAPGFVTNVAGQEATAYVTGTFGLIVLDVSDPAEPVITDTFDAGGETAFDVRLVGNRVLVAGLGGLFNMYATDFSSYSHFPVAGGAFGTDGTNGLLVSDRYEGILLIDGGIPGSPMFHLATYETGGFSHRVAFGGQDPWEGDPLLFVADLGGFVRIFDLEDVTRGDEPALIRRVEVPRNTQSVLVAGDYAFVTNAAPDGVGLTVIDASNPASAHVAGTWSAPAPTFGMALAGDVLLVANGDAGLVALDVSQPASPVELSGLAVGGPAVDVAVRQGVAFVVTFGGGMTAVDISDPAMMTEISTRSEWGFLTGVATPTPNTDPYWPYAFVADVEEGIRTVYVDDPANMTTVELTPVGTIARSIAAGHFATPLTVPAIYAADDYFGMRVAREEGSHEYAAFRSADRGTGVAVLSAPDGIAHDLVALAGGGAGVYLIEGLSEVATEDDPDVALTSVRSIYPNPATTTMSATIYLAASGDVVLEIFDLLGRPVMQLPKQALTAGSHELSLDLTGLSNGVYVLRLTARSEATSQRFTVLRAR